MSDEEHQDGRQSLNWSVEENDLGFADELPTRYTAAEGEPEPVAEEPAPEQPEPQVAPVPERPMTPRQRWPSVAAKAWSRSAARKARLGKPIPPPSDAGQPVDRPIPELSTQPPLPSIATRPTGIESSTETGWEGQPERVPTTQPSFERPREPQPAPQESPPRPQTEGERAVPPPGPVSPETTPQRDQGAPSAGVGGQPPPPATATLPPVREPPNKATVWGTLPFDPNTQKPRLQTAEFLPDAGPPQEARPYLHLAEDAPLAETLPYRLPGKIDDPVDRSAGEPEFEKVPNEMWPMFTPPPITKKAQGPDWDQPHFEMPPEDLGRVEPPPRARPVDGERDPEHRIGVAPLGFENEEGQIEPMRLAEPEPPARPASRSVGESEWRVDVSPPAASVPSGWEQPPPRPDPGRRPEPPSVDAFASGVSGGGKTNEMAEVVNRLDKLIEATEASREAMTQAVEAINALGMKLDSVGTYS